MNTKASKTIRLLGGNSNPFDAFLLINGMRTLEIRMERHCHNATEISNLPRRPCRRCQRKLYRTAIAPDFYLAAKQMRHPGAIMSIELKGGLQAGINMMDRLKMCTRTVSLGTCDTLLCPPCIHDALWSIKRTTLNNTVLRMGLFE
jgi:methionine-gamma-lyase